MEQIARNTKQLGAAIRRRRREMKRSQNDIATKTGIRQATLSRLESGEPAVRLQTLFDALSALSLEVVVRPRTKASSKEIEEMLD